MSQCPSTTRSSGASVSGTLHALHERGDHYRLVNVGLNHLENDPDDTTVRLLVFRSYVVLGLIGPARDLLRGAAGHGSLPAEITAMRTRIARMPSGRIAWSSLQDRFESNVARLYQRFPEMREHDAVFRNIPRHYELYRTRDGNVHFATRNADHPRRWLPDLCDVPATLANAKLPHDPQALFCGPYLVVGDRLGALFNRVFEATEKMFLTFSPRIYVIETDVAAFGATLYVTASVDRLCHERSALIVGPDSVDRLVVHLEGHPALLAPEFAVGLTAASGTVGDQVFEALRPRAAAIEHRTLAAQETVRRHYESVPAIRWVSRFRSDRKEPLRVLGITGRFSTYLQYSMRDWGAAFEARGHEFRMMIEKNDHDLLPPFHIPEVIEKFKPDLVLCIDHFRHEYPGKIPTDVPFVGWVQDALPHLYSRQCGESLGALDYYIERDAGHLARAYRYPRSRGITWPMVTNERVFSNEPMADEDLTPYRCDFSFVCNQSRLPDQFHQERRATFGNDPDALRLVDYLFEALTEAHRERPENACIALRRLYADAREENGVSPKSPEMTDLVFTAYLYPMSDLIFRQNTLAWIADYCDRTGHALHLYGNGWEKHPRFGRYARGFARNGPELRAIYQASTINLQITSYGAVHQRMLDGLAAGGFFLIRETPGDTMHPLARKLLAAVRRYDARPETPYPFGEMPEVEEAMRELWARYSLRPPQGRYTIPADFLHKFESLEAGEYDQLAGAVFDQYAKVSFASDGAFETLAEHYLGDTDDRAAVASAMRAVVAKRFTYGGLVDRLLSFLGNDLARRQGA